MAKHPPYISVLKFGICLQVAFSPLRLTAALTTDTLGEPMATPHAIAGCGQTCTKIHSLLLSIGYIWQAAQEHGPKGTVACSNLALS